MTDFQRTRSKVWFPTLDDDDEDIGHLHSWRRQPSSSPESRRVSSGSPSNGSHRSQDSGFSDSESGGSPPGPSAAAAAAAGMRPARLPDGVLPELPTACEAAPHAAVPATDSDPHCDCFLPACELSRKFRSYEHVTAAVEAASSFRTPTAAAKTHAQEPSPRTPNRTCFIVDLLPKSGGGSSAGPQTPSSAAQLSTPGSVKSFDGHFDQSENVTVVENVNQPPTDGDDRGDLIIEPPTPFVDRFSDDDAVDGGDRVAAGLGDGEPLSDGPDSPEHTSTPKSTKNRCCTPKLHYRKELQLRKPKNLQASFDR